MIHNLNDLKKFISTEPIFDKDGFQSELEFQNLNLNSEDKINVLIEMYNEFTLSELEEMLKQFKFRKKFIATRNRMLENNKLEQEKNKKPSI